MSEDGHRDPRVNVEGDEEAGAGPPRRVDGDDWDAGLLRPELEVAVKVACDGKKVADHAPRPTPELLT